MYIENKNKEKWSTGTNLWVVNKASTEVGNVEPLGMYAAGKKENKSEPREGRPVGCEARTRSTTGDPWGQVQPSKKKRAGTAGGLGSQSGVDGMGPQELSAGSRWSTTCKYRNTLRGTYAGDQYDASGRQRGTLILSMGPTRTINGTPKVDNVRSWHSSNSLTASLPESSAQRKRWKNKYAKIQERRQRKGKKSSDENNNNAGSIHDATKRLRRGEKDTMEAILAVYQNITARQYVRNVDRLHRR